MSEIRVNTIVAAEGTSAPSLPYGIQVPTGMGITGAGGLNITGVVTAANIDGTLIAGSAINSAGVSTVGILTVTKDARIGAAVTIDGAATITGALTGTTGTFSGAVSGTTGTFSGAVNVDATTDSTSSTTGALIVDGGLGVAKNVYIGAGLSVAGTLTYEDVTSVDSVGLITAKSGVNITGGQLTVGSGITMGIAGVATFSGTSDIHLHDSVRLLLGTGSDLRITHDGSHGYIQENTGNLRIDADTLQLRSSAGENYLYGAADGAVTLYHDSSAKLATSATGITVTGNATATKFLGDGSSLTGVGGDMDITSCLFV